MSKSAKVYFITKTTDGPVGILLDKTGPSTVDMTVYQWSNGQDPQKDGYHSSSVHPLRNIVISKNCVRCTTQVVFWNVNISMVLGNTSLDITISDAPSQNGTTKYPIEKFQYNQIETFIKDYVSN